MAEVMKPSNILFVTYQDHNVRPILGNSARVARTARMCFLDLSPLLGRCAKEVVHPREGLARDRWVHRLDRHSNSMAHRIIGEALYAKSKSSVRTLLLNDVV